MVIIFAIVLILSFGVRLDVVKFDVNDAILTQQFNNTNLFLNVTARNPSKMVNVYYDYIEARASCDDVKFVSDNLEPFFQHHKTTCFLSLILEAQQQPLFVKKSGFYHIKDGNLLSRAGNSGYPDGFGPARFGLEP
ncbi:hypothetical protein RIF29_18359 [Crotalaria pallida]|uniref:Uncharacterized protein n=1 Tax=Crotalaria pallida TaxID=3830 RepID=A0AAN9IDU4_CROPI